MQPTSISTLTEVTKPIIRLFRALAAMLRGLVQPTENGSAADMAQLAEEARQEQAHEEELRRKYAGAHLRQHEFEARAAQHRIKFTPLAQPHHRAAILDYLDNPGPTLLTPMHATWFFAVGEDGRSTGSLAHPAVRARYTITSRWAARHGWQSEHFTAERVHWSTEQWLDYQRREHEELKTLRHYDQRPNRRRNAPSNSLQ